MNRDDIVETSDDFEILFSDEDGNPITIREMAKTLPLDYSSSRDGLPTLSERVEIDGLDNFYDFFQVMYVREDMTSSAGFPNEVGWYWLTYYEPAGCGFGYIGPFAEESEALDDACSKSLPINDQRRSENPSGFIGNDDEIAFSIPTFWKSERQ
ncbi:hypothetical protein MTBPR1_140045 [Candidatus Terasakiella magnetica]|uniref:Uncharacterized protein n=1 Tax=Candidatus Terasakiella magnetica TaxID=1867952 RepID=A0A1C3RF69_9PROT|nr:hypothetical protein [Candidatus Terasakiella magnetica]SCA55927.1 hypothetical protein MTBPR1_140045 [Candidatus Terasakiella magnetica]